MYPGSSGSPHLHRRAAPTPRGIGRRACVESAAKSDQIVRIFAAGLWRGFDSCPEFGLRREIVAGRVL